MKLYFESSVFNFIFAEDAPEKQKITKVFFTNKLNDFDLFISDLVINELGKTKEPKAMKELHRIREKMSKMSDKELLKELEGTRKKYKDIISAGELKAKKIVIKV